jgi:hypothetical protein
VDHQRCGIIVSPPLIGPLYELLAGPLWSMVEYFLSKHRVRKGFKAVCAEQ